MMIVMSVKWDCAIIEMNTLQVIDSDQLVKPLHKVSNDFTISNIKYSRDEYEKHRCDQSNYCGATSQEAHTPDIGRIQMKSPDQTNHSAKKGSDPFLEKGVRPLFPKGSN